MGGRGARGGSSNRGYAYQKAAIFTSTALPGKNLGKYDTHTHTHKHTPTHTPTNTPTHTYTYTHTYTHTHTLPHRRQSARAVSCKSKQQCKPSNPIEPPPPPPPRACPVTYTKLHPGTPPPYAVIKLQCKNKTNSQLPQCSTLPRSRFVYSVDPSN